jgi:hypothetical protein
MILSPVNCSEKMSPYERSNTERGVERRARKGISYFPVGVFVWGYWRYSGVLRVILPDA